MPVLTEDKNQGVNHHSRAQPEAAASWEQRRRTGPMPVSTVITRGRSRLD